MIYGVYPTLRAISLKNYRGFIGIDCEGVYAETIVALPEGRVYGGGYPPLVWYHHPVALHGGPGMGGCGGAGGCG